MTKSLLIHASERIDVEDFNLAATGFTRDSLKEHVTKCLTDKHSRTLEGFRIEIADQDTFPGQVTIHNGTALDRSGQIINIEDQEDASLTVTLSGSNQSFYLEIEFSETESDVNARGFWDPTVDNASPVPDGAEAVVNVSTRVTPSWSIVYPVSTVGFDFVNNPSSTKIPLALINTDASNKITSSVNEFSSLVNALTTIETDLSNGDNTLTLVDSRYFPVNSTITVGLDSDNEETSLTVTSNDTENNIITVNPVLSNSHVAGEIVKRTDITGNFLPESADPNDPDYLLGVQSRPNDHQKRLWQGDEVRGSAIISSKYSYGSRDDLSVRNLKDYVDAVSAEIRELKFGHPRPEETSTAPPSTFSSRPRWFDKAGSVTGARTASVTIGNGTSSFGDFNGTNEDAFTAAIAALPSDGGTIFVKPGTYTFANSVTISSFKNVCIAGDSTNTSIIEANVPDSVFLLGNSSTLILNNVTLQGGASYSIKSVNTTDAISIFGNNSHITGISASSGSVTFNLENFNISRDIEAATIRGSINNSTISGSFVGKPSSLKLSGCSLVSSSTILDCSAGAASGFLMDNCSIVYTPSTSVAAFIFADGFSHSNLAFNSCTYSLTASFVPAGNTPAILNVDGIDGLFIDNCTAAINGQPGTANDITYFAKITDSSNVLISNTVVTGTSGDYDGAFDFSNGSTQASISNCKMNVASCVDVKDTTGSVSITNCIFDATGKSAKTWYGLKSLSGSTMANIHISNTIFNGANVGGSGIKNGIRVGSSGECRLTVDSSCFINMGDGTGSDVKGIHVTSNDIDLSVNNCTFDDLAGTTSVYGVYITPSLESGSTKVKINNNSFVSISGTTSVGFVYVNDVDYLDLTGNILNGLTLQTGSAVTVSGPASVCKASICNNVISNITGSTGAITVVDLTNCLATVSNVIDTVAATATLKGVSVAGSHGTSVCNNTLKSLSTTSGTLYGVYAFSDHVTCSSNSISSLSNTTGDTHAIYSTFSYKGIFTGNCIFSISGSNSFGVTVVSGDIHTISDNSLENITGTSTDTTCINCVSSFCSINSNTITSTDRDDTVWGIKVTDDNNTITGNSINGDFQAAINISGANGCSVNSNSIYFTGVAAIFTESSAASSLAITGNQITLASADNVYGIYLSADSGNNVTVSGNAIRKTAESSAQAIVSIGSFNYLAIGDNICHVKSGITTESSYCMSIISYSATISGNNTAWPTSVANININISSTGSIANNVVDISSSSGTDFKGTCSSKVVVLGNVSALTAGASVYDITNAVMVSGSNIGDA